jgi:hypothetical protein
VSESGSGVFFLCKGPREVVGRGSGGPDKSNNT